MLKTLKPKFRSDLSVRLDITEKHVPANLKPIVERSFRAIEPSGRMIGREKSQGHLVVPNKDKQESLSVTMCAPPPPTLNTPLCLEE